MITPSRITLCVLIAWLIGIGWPVYFDLQVPVIVAATLLIICITRHSFVRLITFSAISYLAASLYFYHYYQNVIPDAFYGKTTEWQLTILEKPTKDGDRARYLARTPDKWLVYLTLPRASPVSPGRQLTLTGSLAPLSKEQDEWDRRSSTSRKIFGRIEKPRITAEQPANLSFFDSTVLISRQFFDQTTRRLFTDPQGALFAGIVAGAKNDLPKNISDDFRTTGLSHLVAVSGFNVTIVIQLFGRLTQRLGKRLHLFASLFVISWFVLFTGASASVVRAGILAGLFIVARTLGRKVSIIRLIIVTAVIMTLSNPLILRYDIGFQLSYAAVLGLIWFAALIQEKLEQYRLWPWLAETVAATSAAQIATFPLLAHYFGQLAPYSLPANVAVGPLIPWITVFGIPLILLTGLLPFLTWLAYPFDLALRYSIFASHFIANLPYTDVSLPSVPVWLWPFYLLPFAYWRLRWQPKEA